MIYKMKYISILALMGSINCIQISPESSMALNDNFLQLSMDEADDEENSLLSIDQSQPV